MWKMCIEKNYDLILVIVGIADVFLVLFFIASAIAFRRQNKELEAFFRTKREMDNCLKKEI
jgi:Na+-transporting methylmalonyl-CoA/oxaloacetate decarboxylase gamma subunit